MDESDNNNNNQKENEPPSNVSATNTTTPTKSQNAKSNAPNLFASARACLQLSALPDSLPGREEERGQIMEIIQRCIQNRGSGASLCMCFFLDTLWKFFAIHSLFFSS